MLPVSRSFLRRVLGLPGPQFVPAYGIATPMLHQRSIVAISSSSSSSSLLCRCNPNNVLAIIATHSGGDWGQAYGRRFKSSWSPFRGEDRDDRRRGGGGGSSRCFDDADYPGPSSSSAGSRSFFDDEDYPRTSSPGSNSRDSTAAASSERRESGATELT